ncbi:MAG: LacI family DNA-binding transcriptional regulator [Candidatus Devosia phytovorans]|uniref:LacI family DNA-binding transcriptional regulator n=1 Tax=Candidatus Devosia phytovorans TaxID=3121372 RepID=A0AAJ5VT04_9HYPH|nr:LacI family DNA-binding transcriptional regulator [Devosia sp.]WEK03616.1 MAG: LacI family DNA-binding transcriptional regulator [Devosia sp.]
MATIDDVSKRAGVSRSTVSRVIADNGYVSDAKRRAIQQAITELGYRPNTLAQALRSNRSNMIGSVVVDVGTPFYADMVGGIQAACRKAGKSLVVSSGFASQEEESRAIIELVDRSCDGLVLYLEHPIRGDVVAILRQASIPVVVIGSNENAIASGAVLIDNAGGAALAVQHVLDLGHRNIAYLSGQLEYRDTRSRLAGIEAALPVYGLSLSDLHIVHGQYSEKFGFAAIADMLASHPGITAVLAGDDDIAAGALLALKHHGRRVPEDVTLVGFDDNFHARHLTPALTTIRQPVFDAGRSAAEMLVAILGSQAVTENEIIVPTYLVERATAAPPAQRERRTG